MDHPPTPAASSARAGIPRVPRHLWIIGILALLWNAVGAFDYLMTQLQAEAYMSGFTEAQRAFFYGLPAWTVAAWAVAVWFSVAGALALLVRSRWAVGLFALALVGLAVTTLHNFGLSNGREIMGSGGLLFSALIWIVAVALLLYARRMARRGVLH